MHPRVICHLDIDAFFASVEQILVPRLSGRPVAVGSGVIASCSYEARAFGLYAGQPLSEARRQCPGLVILPGSQIVYRSFAEQVWELCRETAPAVETHLDDAYLDLSGTEGARGDPESAVALLRARIRRRCGLAATAGIGPSRMVARIAGKTAKPDGLRLVRPDEVEDMLIDLPVMQIPGVGPKTAALLAKFNVCTVRDLREVPLEALTELFGKNGEAIYERARGRDTRAISEREIPRTISRETTFHRETTDPAEIHGMLHYLSERAMKAVRELGVRARTVALKVRYADMKQVAAQRRLGEATAFTSPVFDTAVDLLRTLHVRRVSVRHVGVALSGIALDQSGQLELFADVRRERLVGAVDEVRRQHGFAALTMGRSLELIGKLRQDDNGFVLRTPSLTK